MIRGAIFDMDGTLLDSMPLWDNAGEIYLSRLGIRAKPGLGKILFPMTMQQGAAYLKKEYALPLSETEIISGINQTVTGFYLHDAPLKNGVLEFLNGLKAAGIKLAVATVTDRSCAESALCRLGVRPYFHAVLTATEVGSGKEQPVIYQKAAAALGTAAAETLVFEDALYAAKTAKNAGFITAGICDASSADQQNLLQKVCDYYLIDFGDFAAFAAKALK